MRKDWGGGTPTKNKMTKILELSYKDFKATIIKMLKAWHLPKNRASKYTKQKLTR